MNNLATRTRAWKDPDAFPVIKRIIEELYQKHRRLISVKEIVAGMLRDPAAGKFVRETHNKRRGKSKRSPKREASDMVAGFSQRYETSGYKATIYRAALGHSYAYKPRHSIVENLYPDVVRMRQGEKFPDGAVKRVLVNAYERSDEARDRCLAKYGTNCFICDFSFGTTYGKRFHGFIHVHHLRKLGEIGKEYLVDPIVDLRSETSV